MFKLPEYRLRKDKIVYNDITFEAAKHEIDTYKRVLFYAKSEDVKFFETTYPNITFWLLPNDNNVPGFSKYLAVNMDYIDCY